MRDTEVPLSGTVGMRFSPRTSRRRSGCGSAPTRVLFAGVLAAAALVACDPALVAMCPSDLRVSATPPDTTLVVGQSMVASASAYTCGGTERLDWPIWFESEDPGVLTVDSATARVTAVGPGTTRVRIHSEPGGMIGLIPVEVTAAP